jgi:hypothetical protein
LPQDGRKLHANKAGSCGGHVDLGQDTRWRSGCRANIRSRRASAIIATAAAISTILRNDDDDRKKKKNKHKDKDRK